MGQSTPVLLPASARCPMSLQGLPSSSPPLQPIPSAGPPGEQNREVSEVPFMSQFLLIMNHGRNCSQTASRGRLAREEALFRFDFPLGTRPSPAWPAPSVLRGRSMFAAKFCRPVCPACKQDPVLAAPRPLKLAVSLSSSARPLPLDFRRLFRVPVRVARPGCSEEQYRL